MNAIDATMTGSLTLLFALVGGAVLLWAVVRAPWRALIAMPSRQHAFLASLLAVALLWTLQVELPGGATLHLLGMTTVTLMFGWELAVVLGALAGLALAVAGTWSFAALPVNFALVALVPVATTMALLAAANALRRTNLFVYMLGLGFAGGGLALGASLALGAWLTGTDLDHAVVLLMVFPEGFINGTVVSAMAVFLPGLLRTYDDTKYLDR